MDLTTPIITKKLEIFIFKILDKRINDQYLFSDRKYTIDVRDNIDRLLHQSGHLNDFTMTGYAPSLLGVYIYLKALSKKINKSIYTINYGDIIKNVDLSDIVDARLISYFSDDYKFLGFPFKSQSIEGKWVKRNGLKFYIKDSDLKKSLIGVIHNNILYYRPGLDLFNSGTLESKNLYHLVKKGEIHFIDVSSMYRIYNEDINELKLKAIEELKQLLYQYLNRIILVVPLVCNNGDLINLYYKVKKLEHKDGSFFVDLELTEIMTKNLQYASEEFKNKVLKSLKGESIFKSDQVPSKEYIMERTEKELNNSCGQIFLQYKLNVLMQEDCYLLINKITG